MEQSMICRRKVDRRSTERRSQSMSEHENGSMSGWKQLLLMAIGILVMTIISGSYYYTSSIASDLKSEDTNVEKRVVEERHIWRSEHNKVLDERFKVLEKNQESLQVEIHQNQEKVEKGFDKLGGKLDELLIEQRAQSRPSSQRRAR